MFELRSLNEGEAEGMNAFTSAMFINLGLIILAGVGIYVREDLWPLVSLLFMVSAKDKEDE